MKIKAKLKQPIYVRIGNGTVEKLDKRTALYYLHKEKWDKEKKYIYWFCVKKFHGSGVSGLCLIKKEFEWVK